MMLKELVHMRIWKEHLSNMRVCEHKLYIYLKFVVKIYNK